MGVQLLSVFWGQKHVDLFINAALKSLTFSKNKQALIEAGATWNIFTETHHFDQIREAIRERVPEIEMFELQSVVKLRDRTDHMLSALIWQIEKCLLNKEKLLLVMPDTIWGDGSIPNLFKVGHEPTSCVVVPHPRVLPEILNETYESNQSLVNAAFKHLHRSWSEAKVGHPRQNSFVGGTSWVDLGENQYSVCHRLPTVYYAGFTDEDLQYFKTQVGFGTYDHTWPGHILIPRDRQRTIGSSDVAFVCEITDADKNVPPVMRGGDPDKFWKANMHNNINAIMRTTFRG